jgi:uncharacterized protein YqjF (DUF2071 family)
MLQRWERLTFVHWQFDAATVQRVVPEHLTVETFDGAAWVGLVPFVMRVGTANGRTAPWLSHFCETNVRTYVRDREGRSGIWFLSLDAARLAAVVTARVSYRLPYFWSRMQIEQHGDEIAYECRRMTFGRTVTSRVRVRILDPLDRDRLDARDHFLTARWLLFNSRHEPSRFARACHEPWPLHAAEVLHIDDRLVETAGLPRPDGDPIAHYSNGVDVRIGWPEHSRSRSRM